MSVGETLRKAREAKGLSLEDVKNSTQMMLRQIQEMEEDDFSSFADPFYAKFFVRLFARAVGLEPGPVVEMFVEQTAGGRGAAPKPAPKPVAAAAAAPEPKPEPEPAPAAAAPEPEAPAPAPAPGTEAPDDLFSLAAAPKPAPAPVPAPAPASEAPKPAAAPARTTAKVVASTPLAFERRHAPNPQPEKRVAAVEPGAPAPAPGPERGARREGRAEFVPPPAAKKLPEPPSAAFRGTASDGRPVAPEPQPLAGPPFRFPEEAGDRTAAAAAPAGAEPAAPVPVLQSRQRKNLAPATDEEIVAAAPAPASAAPAKDEPLFAEKAPKRRREPRPDAPNAASLFLSNLAASARKALSRKPRRGPLLAGAAALVALCVAGGVYLAAGGRGDGSGPDATAGVPPAPRQSASGETAIPAEPPEPIAPVFPPLPSWAK